MADDDKPLVFEDAKDPNDISDWTFDFTDKLGGVDTITGVVFSFDVTAGLTKLAESFTSTTATVTLSGGTSGAMAAITARITTAAGHQFDKTAYLSIVESYVAPSSLVGYAMPTPAHIKMLFEAFAGVADAKIAYAIQRAARSVDTSWTEGDYSHAIMLLACHYLVLGGDGTGAEAQMNAEGMQGFKVIRSASLTLERGGNAGGDSSGVPDEWAGSIYGRQFWRLLRQNKAGGAVANGLAAVPVGPYVWPTLWPYY
jgi:hypothetical protein